jgi:MFS family permease
MNKAIEQRSLTQMHKSIISSLFGTFGSSIFAFGLSLKLLEQTGSAMSFAAGQIIMPITAIVLLPFVGPMTDKYSRKKIIITSQLVTNAGLLAYVLYWVTGAKHFVIASILLMIILRASDQFTSNAQQAAKADLVLPDDLTKLAGYTGTAQNASQLVSSIVGAVLFTTLPFPVFIAFEIFTEVVTLWITSTLDFKLADNHKDTNAEHAMNDDQGSFKEGLNYITKQKYLFSFIIIAIGLNFFSSVVGVGLPVMLLKSLHLSNLQFGITESFFGAGMILGGLLVAKAKEPKHPLQLSYKLTYWCALITCSIGIVEYGPQNTWFITVVIGLMALTFGILLMFVNTPPMVWMQKEIPSNMQGRVFNVDMAVSMCIMPIGAALFGFLFDLQTGNTSLLNLTLFAIAGIGSALVSFISVRIMKINYKQSKIYTAEEIAKRVWDKRS